MLPLPFILASLVYNFDRVTSVIGREGGKIFFEELRCAIFAALFSLRYSRCSALFARLDLAHGYLYLAFGLPSWKGT